MTPAIAGLGWLIAAVAILVLIGRWPVGRGPARRRTSALQFTFRVAGRHVVRIDLVAVEVAGRVRAADPADPPDHHAA